jgi:hypothetical protein
MPIGLKVFFVLMALFAFVWLRYAWQGFGGQVKDLEAHRNKGLMRLHFSFVILVIVSCILLAIFA